MSHDDTQRTKLGPGFDVRSVGGTPTTLYNDEEDMEDTASSSVKFLGETIPETDVPSLGLTLQDATSTESLHDVTGPCMAVAWNLTNMAISSTSNVPSGAYVTDPTTSGSHVPPDVTTQADAMAALP